MEANTLVRRRLLGAATLLVGLILVLAIGAAGWSYYRRPAIPAAVGDAPRLAGPLKSAFRPREPMDLSGFLTLPLQVKPWKPDASLEEVGDCWKDLGYRVIETIDQNLKQAPDDEKIGLLVNKAIAFNYEGEPAKAYQVLEEARSLVKGKDELDRRWLYTLIYCQGVTALRRGENENCIMCRGESSCILPIAPAAVHVNPKGSRTAIKHFTEYLQQFPDDLEIRWLLNLAHMTLGEHPDKVDPRFRVSLDRYTKPEFDIGKFRDVGHLVGVNRFNQAGGAVMDDFDNDGRLDIAITSFDPNQAMAFFHNKGDGTFEDRTASVGVADQLGGLFCVQTDYDNDGNLDIYIPRGAWLAQPIRPTLLRNRGDGTFGDVTKEAGLLDPVNSNSAAWADYDNDGFLDLFVCCERQPNRLYHNSGDGTFEEVSLRAGIEGFGQTFCKGAAWLDYDNDRFPDLFLNFMNGTGLLFHNNQDSTFTDVTQSMGINGPRSGFSCWAWDYDNDGWLDIFATCYDRTLEDVVKGLLGQPHKRQSNRLYRNLGGRGFKDVTKQTGLDLVFATMGSNYGDFDNDGFLDMYLGTGEPNLATLVPKRMFKNVDGKRFADVTGPSGTGHLQKGHAVACGDWDRDGDVDIFIELGGAVNGDRYHNVLFQNPGHGNHWLTLKLVGKKTNRAAIGARIKVVTDGDTPLTVHRHVSSGSSFGANPLQQTIGLAKARKVALLEITWPTSGTTQVFHDIPVDQAIEITEFADAYRTLDRPPLPQPK